MVLEEEVGCFAGTGSVKVVGCLGDVVFAGGGVGCFRDVVSATEKVGCRPMTASAGRVGETERKIKTRNIFLRLPMKILLG